MSEEARVTECERAMAAVVLAHELPTNNNDSLLAELAACIGAAERILVLTGAGISTSAGLPDFRSTSTGDKRIDARMLSRSELRRRPIDVMRTLLELRAGPEMKPTPTHRFVKLLSDKGKLKRWYTQNIDGLERRTGIATSALRECHGSMASPITRCSSQYCKQRFRMTDLEKALSKGQLLICQQCQGSSCKDTYARPDVVLYGDPLGHQFGSMIHDSEEADLLLIFGTSLQVAPVCNIPCYVRQSARKFWICREFPEKPYILLPADMTRVHGSCDAVVEGLVERLGWQESFAAAAGPSPLV